MATKIEVPPYLKVVGGASFYLSFDAIKVSTTFYSYEGSHSFKFFSNRKVTTRKYLQMERTHVGPWRSQWNYGDRSKKIYVMAYR